MTAVTDLLARVRAAGVRMEADGDYLQLRGPAPLPDDVLAELHHRKHEVLAVLSVSASTGLVDLQRQTEKPVDVDTPEDAGAGEGDGPLIPARYCERLLRAADWLDLGRVLDDGQMEYVAGLLPGEVVECIAEQCCILSRRLPEEARCGPSVRTEDLLPVTGPVCYVCGQRKWWTDRYGNRKCAVCQPPAKGGE
jgi:hypothetical protein